MSKRRQELVGKQRLAFMIVKDWIDGVAESLRKHGHAREVKPLRLLIKGTAGTGKSFVIERINEYAEEVARKNGWAAPNEAAAVAAYTGVAAFNVKGRTLHSLCGLPTDPKHFDDLEGGALDRLQQKLSHTKLLILDERSMIGRRTFSWISERCKQGKVNGSVSFGGLGVIQLGDDAQLPPIGDLPLYTRHVRASSRFDEHTVAGVGLVDEFIPSETRGETDVQSEVVTLDVLHRQKGTEKKQLQFKRALAHLRDGCWGTTKRDADKALVRDYVLFLTRRLSKLPKDEQKRFEAALRLFATNDKVNAFDREKLRKLRRRCTIHSVNNGPGANDASADAAGGLQRKVYVASGARVMLTSNIWAEKGLVNGAIGVVKGICFAGSDVPPAMPSCVIVHFPQYEGPSFRPDLYGPNCVPISPLQSQWSQKAQGGYTSCTRVQLPLKLAWAITIHKSQGLTIGHGSPTAETVVIDIGNREMCAGLTFVAISRAKRLDDIAFAFPIFSIRRLSRCGEGKHLQTRKDFEAKLDRAGELTAQRYQMHWPFGELDCTANADDTNSDDKDQNEMDDDEEEANPDLLAMITPKGKHQNQWYLAGNQANKRRALGVDDPTTKKAPETRSVDEYQRIRQSFYDANMAVINRTLPYPATQQPPALRQRTARHQKRMKMRIVDFIAADATKFSIATWARRLGFEVIVDRVAVDQPSCECGYIAARVMSILKSARALWSTIDTSSANHPNWVTIGNMLLGYDPALGNSLGVHWLSEEETMKLAAVWNPDNQLGGAVLGWELWQQQTAGTTGLQTGQLSWMRTGSLDECLRRIAEAIQNDETIPERSPQLFVCNTEDSRTGGYHWISVAFSIDEEV